jgi:hypothetical protein
VLEIAAFQKLPHDRPDDWPPEAIPLLGALLVDRLELREEALDLPAALRLAQAGQPVKCRLLRVPGTTCLPAGR